MTEHIIKCTNCHSTGWVCENHNDVAWYGVMPDGAYKCCGGAGMPCKECNPCDEYNPPRFAADFVVVLDERGFHPHIVAGKDKI